MSSNYTRKRQSPDNIDTNNNNNNLQKTKKKDEESTVIRPKKRRKHNIDSPYFNDSQSSKSQSKITKTAITNNNSNDKSQSITQISVKPKRKPMEIISCISDSSGFLCVYVFFCVFFTLVFFNLFMKYYL